MQEVPWYPRYDLSISATKLTLNFHCKGRYYFIYVFFSNEMEISKAKKLLCIHIWWGKHLWIHGSLAQHFWLILSPSLYAKILQWLWLHTHCVVFLIPLTAWPVLNVFLHTFTPVTFRLSIIFQGLLVYQINMFCCLPPSGRVQIKPSLTFCCGSIRSGF